MQSFLRAPGSVVVAGPLAGAPAQVAAAAADGGAALTLHRLADPSAVRRVLRDLAADDHRTERFPGPNPVSLDSSHFGQLRGQPYYICEKTDGVRHALVCCTLDAPELGRRVNVCALVDRALAVYLLPLGCVPRAAYQGTLLDGEVAWNRARRRWEYIVFDAVCVSGIPVLNATLPRRLDAVHRVLRVYGRATPDPSPDPLDLRVKTFVPCTKLADYEASLDRINRQYATDGVILTPAVTPVQYGRHHGMFKLKCGEGVRHTVDFLVGADGRTLCVFDSGTHVAVGALRPGEASVPPRSVAECAPVGDGTWALVHLRTDKTTANDMYTYQKTLLNARENLGLRHLHDVFPQHQAPPPLPESPVYAPPPLPESPVYAPAEN